MKTIRVFYSWESDLPRETNNHGIRLAIKEACLTIQKKDSAIEIVNDEATREVTGSPNIPATIFLKIKDCDLFVADITTINSKDIATRKVSNPNVLIELGYAIPIIGWERILLLFNKSFGTFPNDIPFDIDKHRIIDFKITDKDDKNGKGQLVTELVKNIESIIKANPQKQYDKLQPSSDQIKRKNDISTISNYMCSLHLPTMDEFIDNLPNRISDKVFFFWEDFIAKYNCSCSHIYDQETSNMFMSFKTIWGRSLSFGHRYDYNNSIEYFIFGSDMDTFTEEQQKDFNELLSIREKLYDEYKKLIIHIREKWIEIDVNKCSHNAIHSYNEFHTALTSRMETNKNTEA